jgi:hypothetical protein
MKMKRVIKLVLGMTMLLLVIYVSGCATVPAEPQVKATVSGETRETASHPLVKTQVIARPGDVVHLFHGGNKVAKEEFCVNEIVPVYRYFGVRYKTASKSEVGKVKITRYLGDHYIEGIVVEGDVKDGDVAMKPNSACMIRLPEPENQ